MASRNLPKETELQQADVSLGLVGRDKLHDMKCNKTKHEIVCYHEVKRANNDSYTIGIHSSLTQFTPLLEGRCDWPKETQEWNLLLVGSLS